MKELASNWMSLSSPSLINKRKKQLGYYNAKVEGIEYTGLLTTPLWVLAIPVRSKALTSPRGLRKFWRQFTVDFKSLNHLVQYLLSGFLLNGHIRGFHPQTEKSDLPLVYNMLNSTTGKYCSVAFTELNGHTLGYYLRAQKLEPLCTAACIV